MLAIIGAAITLVPAAPAFQINQELALTLFVAPVLLGAAYETSVRVARPHAAAKAVLRQLRLPHRLMVILDGSP